MRRELSKLNHDERQILTTDYTDGHGYILEVTDDLLVREPGASIRDITYGVIGAMMCIIRLPGFLEKVYERAMLIALRRLHDAVPQASVPVYYHGVQVETTTLTYS